MRPITLLLFAGVLTLLSPGISAQQATEKNVNTVVERSLREWISTNMFTIERIEGDRVGWKWDIMTARISHFNLGILTIFDMKEDSTRETPNYYFPFGINMPVLAFGRKHGITLNTQFYLLRPGDINSEGDAAIPGQPQLMDIYLEYDAPYFALSAGYRHQFQDWKDPFGKIVSRMDGLFFSARAGLRFSNYRFRRRSRPMSTAEVSRMTRRWEQAQRSGDIKALEGFVRKYPTSQYRPAASRKILALRWASVKRQNTPQATEAFLKQYPLSRYRDVSDVPMTATEQLESFGASLVPTDRTTPGQIKPERFVPVFYETSTSSSFMVYKNEKREFEKLAMGDQAVKPTVVTDPEKNEEKLQLQLLNRQPPYSAVTLYLNPSDVLDRDALSWMKKLEERLALVFLDEQVRFRALLIPNRPTSRAALENAVPDGGLSSLLSNFGERGIPQLAHLFVRGQAGMRNAAASALAAAGKSGQVALLDSLKISTIRLDTDDASREQVMRILKAGDQSRNCTLLTERLTHWGPASNIALLYDGSGCRPRNAREEHYLRIARRDAAYIRANKGSIEPMLLQDILKGDRHRKQNALFTFIALGSEERLEMLKFRLNFLQDPLTGAGFYNSGRPELRAAAREWAGSRKISLSAMEKRTPVKWGEWR